MTMTTTLTLAYEGAPACVDCQREGAPVCGHVGFNSEAWAYMPGQSVNVPGLDPAFVHTVRQVEISSDRKTVTLTVETERPALLELARHLSTLTDHRAKATIRATHHETGETLAEGRYDAFLQPGQQVCVNGELHTVQTTDHPNRNEYGVCPGDLPDVQEVALAPTPQDPIQPTSGLMVPADLMAALGLTPTSVEPTQTAPGGE